MSVLKELLNKAVSLGASDIHIKSGSEPFFRIRSELHESGFAVASSHDVQTIVADIIPNYLVESYERSHEADFSLHEAEVGRFRVNIFHTQGVPALALRHVKSEVPTFDELHLPEQLADLAQLQRGVVLLSGTTGCGKSTTLAAIISEINRTQRRRIITLEDPVEYVFADEESVISQREVGLDTENYEVALKHVLRQDPDVILIGEMRDQLSIRTALLAAETGHLVMSTLHAGTASLAIPRMLDVFPADEQDQIRMSFAGTEHAIVCQRLIPSNQGTVVPALEIMRSTSTVRKMLEKNQLEQLGAAIEVGNDEGMMTFNQSIYHLIKEGLVSEKEGMRYATNPESLRMNLQGIFLDEGRRILGS